MKILFVSVYYPAFLKSFYRTNYKKAERLSFDKHRKLLLNELFGDADFYSNGVKENDHQAEDIIANDEILQKKWADDKVLFGLNSGSIFLNIPYLKIIFKPNWVEKILEAQIKEISPDIVYFHDIEYFSLKFLKRIKRKYFVVAQKASPIWRIDQFKQTNLVFTSFPHFVQMFRLKKINSEYLKLAFGEKVLEEVQEQKKVFNCTFIGGITSHHSKGNKILEEVARKERIDIFGYGKENLKKYSTLYNMHHGEVWGKEMYKIMMQSKMTINRHINVAGKYANNMRMFEATGCGTFLFTDDKKNISDFFDNGREIVTYKDAKDLTEKIRYYTEHVKEREKIAKDGQLRTLREHNYKVRMKEMLSMVSKYS